MSRSTKMNFNSIYVCLCGWNGSQTCERKKRQLKTKPKAQTNTFAHIFYRTRWTGWLVVGLIMLMLIIVVAEYVFVVWCALRMCPYLWIISFELFQQTLSFNQNFAHFIFRIKFSCRFRSDAFAFGFAFSQEDIVYAVFGDSRIFRFKLAFKFSWP